MGGPIHCTPGQSRSVRAETRTSQGLCAQRRTDVRGDAHRTEGGEESTKSKKRNYLPPLAKPSLLSLGVKGFICFTTLEGQRLLLATAGARDGATAGAGARDGAGRFEPRCCWEA